MGDLIVSELGLVMDPEMSEAVGDIKESMVSGIGEGQMEVETGVKVRSEDGVARGLVDEIEYYTIELVEKRAVPMSLTANTRTTE